MAARNNITDRHSPEEKTSIGNMKIVHEDSITPLTYIPPKNERQFLNSIMAFEMPEQEKQLFKVFDKIGRPGNFKPVEQIPPGKITDAWLRLHKYLNTYGIELFCCSPNVTAKELYRFTTTELFNIEIENTRIPGSKNCFIYDDFYPDHKYENTRIATEECINFFFRKGEFYDFHFADKVQLNGYPGIPKPDLKYVVQNFKNIYDKIEIKFIKAKKCTITEEICIVTGLYEAVLLFNEQSTAKHDNWAVQLVFKKELGLWLITKVQIKGINF